MKRHTIKNQNNIDLVVNIEVHERPKGLAFVVHGLGGFKEQIHIKAMIDTFYNAGYTVIAHDAANTLGESGGKMEEATLTNYYEDFLDVVAWAKKQDFYQAPFIVSGHSLGGACAILYASQFPQNVKAIAPISAFIGGDSYKDTRDAGNLKEWKSKGYRIEESKSKPGVMKKINWSFMEDALTYDLQKDAEHIECPVLLVTGSEDTGTPESSQRLIETAVQGPVEVHIIEGMAHNPRSEEHISELKGILGKWLAKVG